MSIIHNFYLLRTTTKILLTSVKIMSRWKSFFCYAESISLLSFLQIVMVVTVLPLHHYHQTCDAITNNKTYCPPSSCGKISNIKHPFRLMDDPTSCGDQKYELSCENNITVLTLFSGKYYVQEINYVNYTIRLVDPAIEEGNCSSIPRYFLTSSNFTVPYNDINGRDLYQMDNDYGYIIYLKCSKQVNDDPDYVDTAPCISSDSKSYLYAFAADFWVRDYRDEYDLGYEESYFQKNYFSVGRLKDNCQVKLVVMSSSDFPNVSVREDVPDRSISYQEIHGMLLYGFQLSWMSGACRESCGDTQQCSFNQTIGNFECYDPSDSDSCIYPLGMEANKRCGKKYCFFLFLELEM
jgi:hypothetical protein